MRIELENLDKIREAASNYEGFIPIDQLKVYKYTAKILNNNQFNIGKVVNAIELYNIYNIIRPIRLYKNYVFKDGEITLAMALLLKIPSIPYIRAEKEAKYIPDMVVNAPEIYTNVLESKYRLISKGDSYKASLHDKIMNKQGRRCIICSNSITLDINKTAKYRLGEPLQIRDTKNKTNTIIVCENCKKLLFANYNGR